MIPGNEGEGTESGSDDLDDGDNEEVSDADDDEEQLALDEMYGASQDIECYE